MTIRATTNYKPIYTDYNNGYRYRKEYVSERTFKVEKRCRSYFFGCQDTEYLVTAGSYSYYRPTWFYSYTSANPLDIVSNAEKPTNSLAAIDQQDIHPNGSTS